RITSVELRRQIQGREEAQMCPRGEFDAWVPRLVAELVPLEFSAARNLVSLCAAHHLHGVHLGYIRVRGRAPDRLRWELGFLHRSPGPPRVAGDRLRQSALAHVAPGPLPALLSAERGPRGAAAASLPPCPSKGVCCAGT